MWRANMWPVYHKNKKKVKLNFWCRNKLLFCVKSVIVRHILTAQRTTRQTLKTVLHPLV